MSDGRGVPCRAPRPSRPVGPGAEAVGRAVPGGGAQADVRRVVAAPGLSSVRRPAAPPTVRRPVCRRAVSSVSRLARPRPRAMSRRPWTVSRTPGRGFVGAQEFDGDAVGLAAYAGLQFGDAGAQLLLVRGGDPELQCGAEQRAGVEVDEGCDDGCGRGLGRGRVRRAAERSSATYSTAAVNRSSRVGKWCWAAPRDTPARSATTETVEPAQPCSARQATAASSSRRRVARLRSCLGRPVGRGASQHPCGVPSFEEGRHPLACLGGGEEAGRAGGEVFGVPVEGSPAP